MTSTETTRPGDKTDELSRGVFLMRKAPAPRRFTARKSFKPVVPDETVEGMERRHEAYVSCWRAADAHVSAVLATANADAFRKLEAFVVHQFATRTAMRDANGGKTPQHLAQQIPAGLVLAGGVNSDDHEETFTKLTRHLRAKGCHTALLRSRDLKARGAGANSAFDADGTLAPAVARAMSLVANGGGGGGGGLGVAVRCILTQLQAGTRGVGEDLNGKGQRTSGRSVRHLRRWYQSVTAEGDAAGTNNTAGGGGSKAEVRGDENTAVGTDADSGKENDESRASIDAAAAAPAARALRERTVAVIGAAATLGTSQPGVMNAESIETPERPVTLLPRRPVVVIVEDTESFDNRVLSDLLLALSDAGDTLPVCVLLGVATSASMMHGIIPAAVAARLRVESFSLWSPKAIMTAVQENVLLDPGFVPAPSNAALELLVTRFAEHDFSLSAARRAMHLLALDHFMTRELSSLAMCMTAAMTAAAAATDALADNDVDADVDDDDVDAADVDASIARIARLATKKKAIANAASEKALEKARAVADETLTPSSVAWAKKHLTDFQTGECWVHSNANDAAASDSIARTVADGYAGRRRWAAALRCVAAAATTARYARDEAKLSTLLVDASSTRWLEFFPETLPPGAHVDASNKAASKAAANKAASKSANTNAISQGEKLLRLLCARLDTAVGESREHAVTDAEVKSLALTWLELIAEDPELYAEESAFLERTARLCDPATRARESRAMEEKKEKAETVKDVKADADARTAFMSPPAAGHSRRSRRSSVSAAHTHTGPTGGAKDAFSTPAPASVQRGKETPATTEAATVVVKPADSKRETLVSPGGAVRAAIHARRRGARDVDMERAAAVAGAGKRAHDANEKDKVLHAAERDEVTCAGRINLAPPGSDDDCVDGRSRAASFLRRVARAHASRPPASLRGRELFCISDSSVRYLRAKSQAAPRLCLEQAMDKPARLLGCACCPKDGGPADTLPDTCGAYTLLQDMGDAANVHEWFREFCETNEPATGIPPNESTKPNKRSKAAKKPAHGLSLPAPGDDSTQMDDGNEMDDDMDDEKKEKGTFHLDRRRLWELQARFTRAVAEIEFLGVGKPVKRRKVEYMQRTAFPLDKLLGGDD